MDYKPEFDSNTFDNGSGKKIKSYFSHICFGILTMFIVSTLTTLGAVELIKRFIPEFMESQWCTFILNFIPQYAFGLPAFFLVVRKVPSLPPEKKKMSFGKWIIAFLIMMGAMYIGNYISNILMMLVGNLNGGQIPQNSIAELLQNSDVLMNMLFVAVLGPVVEELVYRRAVIDRTRAYGEGVSILLSALIFGLVHGNFYQFFYAFIIGLLLAFIYIRTGKIQYTIFAHIGINIFGGVIAPWIVSFMDGDKLNDILNNGITTDILKHENLKFLILLIVYSLYGFLIFGMAVAGIILFMVNRKRFRLGPVEFQLPHDRIGNTVFFNAGAISMMVVLGINMVFSLFQ